MLEIILASKSKIRLEILKQNKINCEPQPSNIDEDEIKHLMIKQGASPEDISRSLAELKANKISQKNPEKVVIGADSVIDLESEIISKPKNRDEALDILKKLNGKSHFLISSVCISKNGAMIWKCTDKAELTMKQMTVNQLKIYLSKINDEKLYAYNVYQIEGEGKSLFTSVKGDVDTIMGLPINKIKEYLKGLK